MLDTVAFELVAVGCTEDFVAIELGVYYLADDISVGEANNEAVFGSIVFVLCLSDEAFAGVVVGLSSTTTLVFGLESTGL